MGIFSRKKKSPSEAVPLSTGSGTAGPGALVADSTVAATERPPSEESRLRITDAGQAAIAREYTENFLSAAREEFGSPPYRSDEGLPSWPLAFYGVGNLTGEYRSTLFVTRLASTAIC